MSPLPAYGSTWINGTVGHVREDREKFDSGFNAVAGREHGAGIVLAGVQKSRRRASGRNRRRNW